MILFLDTEFTGLGHRWPRLISMGLVSEDGRYSFYAELTPESYRDQCSHWVQANIFPLLEGGDRVMDPDKLRQRLTKWISVLGDVRVVTDAPDYDFAFLRATLEPWPANVDPKPIRFDVQTLGDCHKETLRTIAVPTSLQQSRNITHYTMLGRCGGHGRERKLWMHSKPIPRN